MISQSKRSCTAIFSPNGCIAALVRCIAALVRYHTHKSSHLREEKKGNETVFFQNAARLRKKYAKMTLSLALLTGSDGESVSLGGIVGWGCPNTDVPGIV